MCRGDFLQACVIAFTSEFIPKLLYKYAYSTTGTLDGYVDFSLSYYSTSLLQVEKLQANMTDVCRLIHRFRTQPFSFRFKAYRLPSCNISIDLTHKPYMATMACDDEAGYNRIWWHLLAARLIFVVVFEVGFT